MFVKYARYVFRFHKTDVSYDTSESLYIYVYTPAACTPFASLMSSLYFGRVYQIFGRSLCEIYVYILKQFENIANSMLFTIKFICTTTNCHTWWYLTFRYLGGKLIFRTGQNLLHYLKNRHIRFQVIKIFFPILLDFWQLVEVARQKQCRIKWLYVRSIRIEFAFKTTHCSTTQ